MVAVLEGLMLTLVVALVVAVLTARQEGLVNGRFESGAVGEVPAGWFVPMRDYRAETVPDGGRDGGRCVRLRKADEPGKGPPSPFGNLMQSLDARPWRGRPIRLAASVRVLGAGARAQMWLRVDRTEKRMGLFDNMGDRPVRPDAWSECEITGVVDPDAERLNVGMMLFGEGELLVEGFALEATGDTIEFAPPEPPRALSERGLANLLAYAELFGYVRHFHPSDEAAAAWWESLAAEGVRAVEPAASPEELAAALRAHFAALAPSVRVFPTGEAPPEAARADADGAGLVAYWEHRGFGQPGGIYASERAKLSAARLPADVSPPDEPFAAELAGGVSCLVPLSVYVGDDGTLPKAAARAEPAGPARRPSGDDRATRLADVVLAWNVFQHFYPYLDVAEVDWRAELERALRSAATDAGEREFLDTLRRMVAALGDGHGSVQHGSDARAAFLPLDWDWIEGALVVTAVADGIAPHPAPGDVVLSVDGVGVADALARAESTISGATPQWIRARAVRQLLVRASDAPCVLELATIPGDQRVRAELAPRPAPLDRSAGLPAKIAELEPEVWYVDLGRIEAADLEAAIERLADARGIVFDLRGYPRGIGPEELFEHLIETPVTSQQWHVPLVRRPNREALAFERGGEWDLRPREPYLRAEKAFLTGGGAISYAESCMGIVEHYRLAAIVGGPTAGTNGNVNPFELPGGYRVSWTGMKVLKHDGSRHHGVGIAPTVPVERTRQGAAEGRDEVLERALEIVR